jgi:transposase-like protein
MMVIREVCPRCKSARYKKNGHIHNGKQNYHCHDCGRQFVDCFEQYLLSDDTRALIERLLVERIALRGICRAVGVGLKWLLPRFKGLWQRMTNFSGIYLVSST